MPQVSVLLTSYNHEHYLRASIDSVLAQSFEDFEVFVIDDASTDASWEVIKTYTDPRIIPIRSDTNTGGFALNDILPRTEGRYVAVHHSDDIWHPDKLAMQLNVFCQQPDLAVVFTHAMLIDEAGNDCDRAPFNTFFNVENKTRHAWLNFFFYRGNILCHPSALISRSAFDKCGTYRLGLYQLGDFDLWVRLCLNYEIHVIQEKLMKYRVFSDDTNTSAQSGASRARISLEYIEVLKNYLLIKDLDEFLDIFPDAISFYSDGIEPLAEDIPFLLARMALANDLGESHANFALNVLFELLNDPQSNHRIAAAFQFDVRNFAELAGSRGSFGSLAHLRQRLGEVNERLGKVNVRYGEVSDKLVEVSDKLGEARAKLAVARQVRDELRLKNRRLAAQVSELSFPEQRILRRVSRALTQVRKAIRPSCEDQSET